MSGAEVPVPEVPVPEVPGAEVSPKQPASPPWRLRFVLIQLLQLPAVGIALLGQPPTAWWLAAAWGSAVCCGGTDSGWRWRNRLLVFQAMCWLLFALVFAVDEATALF